MFNFNACRGCLAPNINGTFTSLFENPENTSRFDSIAEVSIADDKDEFAALICDSCFDEMTQAFELRRNLRFLEKISFETRRVKNDHQELQVGSSVENDNRKSGEDVSDVTSRSRKSMSNKAQVELPRLREFYVRIERLEDVEKNFNQSCVNDLQKRSAKASGSLQVDRINPTPKSSKCNFCMKTFNSKKYLKNHVNAVHFNIKRFECDFCSYKSYYKSTLKLHLICHKKIIQQDLTPCSCDIEICRELFKTNKAVKFRQDFNSAIAETIHKKQKNFPCEICGRKFDKKSNLKRHVQTTHVKIKLFKCDFCHYKSTIKSDLQRHVVSHIKNPNFKPRETSNPKRSFKCEVENCGKFYKTKRNLNDHEQIHSDARPFVCSICFMTFKLKQNLNRHTKHLHSKKTCKCAN